MIERHRGQGDRPGSGLDIAARLGRMRRELYGEDGVAELAGRLGLPPWTWADYEGA